MDDINFEIINKLSQQMTTMLNPLVQTTNERFQLLVDQVVEVRKKCQQMWFFTVSYWIIILNDKMISITITQKFLM